MITHGMPDSQYSLTIRVISSTEVVNAISGAAQKLSLVDRMDSMSWSVAMSLRDFPIRTPRPKL